MLSYYDKLLGYWEAGNAEEAIQYFEQWKVAGLLSKEEIEKLNEILPEWSQVISQVARTRLLVERREYTQEEFFDMVKRVDREMTANMRWKDKKEHWIKA